MDVDAEGKPMLDIQPAKKSDKPKAEPATRLSGVRARLPDGGLAAPCSCFVRRRPRAGSWRKKRAQQFVERGLLGLAAPCGATKKASAATAKNSSSASAP